MIGLRLRRATRHMDARRELIQKRGCGYFCFVTLWLYMNYIGLLNCDVKPIKQYPWETLHIAHALSTV